ncbi:glycosyltransferase [Stieleria sp. TO1_6]|uniref:glycosyltransferase n=1 Tax=Stieleria tagensis TaxID=2956795 RepID=UPI00209A7A7E|nr:glycosyltransferase [Stieleria tagensis]MCO8123588.1 glycosyltransferase [Stieleria tagensis]
MSRALRRKRVLLVGRYFWPLGSIDSAGHLMDLASGLNRAGMQVSVLTPKHSIVWPDRFTFRELEVHRPIRVFRTGWTARGDRSVSRYVRYLRDWIASDQCSCDLVFCDSGREEAIGVVEAASAKQIPAVVRMSGNGRCSDLNFIDENRMGKRCRSAAIDASAVVLNNATAHRQWLARGGTAETSHRIAVGIGPTIESSVTIRQQLRHSLAKINGDLFVPDASTVVLSVEPMRAESGLGTLVESAYSLAEKINHLQFWLIGDGPSRDSIYTRIRGDGLRQITSMPGSFGQTDDVFAAADLMVHVGDEGFDHQIPSAIAASLPLVIADSPTAREFFSTSAVDADRGIIESLRDADQPPADSGDTAASLLWWFDPARPKTLRFAIHQIVRHAAAARNRADRLRRLLQRETPRSESIAHYVNLFQALIDRYPSTATGHDAPENTL